MRRAALVFASLTTALLITTPGAALDGRRAPREGAVTVTLEQIKELRVHDFVKDEDGMPNLFDQPGLELKFVAAAPVGRKIVDFDAPTQIIARDTAGTDLTNVPKNVFGGTSYVTATHIYGEPVSGFTMKLALPARTATSFDVETSFTALTYVNTEIAVVTPSTSWTQVDQPELGESVKVRLCAQHGAVTVEFQPGTVKERIEKLELFDGKKSLGTQGTMWNDASVNYMFTGEMKDGLTVRLTIRKGLERVPVEVALKGMRLP